MNFEDYNFDDESTKKSQKTWQRLAWPMVIGVLLLGGAIAFFTPKKQSSAPPRKPMEAIVNISAPPPPPPPPVVTPPPPPEPQEQEQEMIKQDEIVEETVEEAPAEDAPDVEATASGPGGADFGLKKSGSGGSGQKRIGGSGRRAGKYDNYARSLQNTIMAALKQNKITQKAKMSVIVRLWADQSGKVTKATLANSCGDRNLDNVLSQEILTGMQLNEPPPSDMPMPIVVQIRATRPN